MELEPYIFLGLVYALLLAAYWLPETSAKAGKISTLSLGFSFYETNMGGWAMSAPAEVGARFGFFGAIGYGCICILSMAIFLLIGNRLDRNFLDFIKSDFGSVVYAITLSVSLAFMSVVLTAELTVIGDITKTMGLPSLVGILPVALCTWAHSSFSKHQIASHGLQGALCVISTVVGISLLLHRSVESLESSLADTITISPQAARGIITLALSTSSAELFNFAEWQRVATAESTRQRFLSLAIACVLNFITLSGFGIVGWIASHNDLERPELAFSSTAESLNRIPRYVVFVMGMLLAASTSDALGCAIASLLSQLVKSGKVAGALMSLIFAYLPSCIIAYQNISIVRLYLYVDILTASAAPPIFTAAIAKGGRYAVFAGLVSALACLALFALFTDLLNDIESIDAVSFYACLLASGFLGTLTPILLTTRLQSKEHN